MEEGEPAGRGGAGARAARSRTFSVFPDDHGMYVARGRLTPDVGALLMRALDAASDALFRETWVPGADTERASAQRRADAVGLLAERALAAGLGTSSVGPVEVSATTGVEARDDVAPDPESRCECSITSSYTRKDTCPEAEVPISGTRAERYQVVLHVDALTLASDGEPTRSELEDGTRVSAETSRRLSCDASVIRVLHEKGGSILDVGRKTRTIPPALRRALEVRDRGCRFPGCGLRFTDAHHVVHWADGGETSLRNCLLLCRHHHRLVHEDGWRIEWWEPGRPVFYDPRGVAHFDGRWQPPEPPEHAVATLFRDNRRAGADPDAWTASARWEREADIPASVYFKACAAL